MTPIPERVDALPWTHDEQVRLDARVARWLPQLRAPLQALYGEVTDIDALVARLLAEVTRGAQLRKPSLRHVDARREARPDWLMVELT